MTQIVLHLRTKNDSNGNPRRLYLPLESDGDIVHVIEEGYRGRGGLKGIANTVYKEIPIEVPISEYNDWVRYGKDQEIYIP